MEVLLQIKGFSDWLLLTYDKHFLPNASSLFQDDNVPIHKVQQLTELHGEYKTDVQSDPPGLILMPGVNGGLW